MNLRKEAKGRECQVRIPGVCNKDRSTTVLAHLNIRSVFMCGMGQKVPDVFGAWACSSCHDVCDCRASAASGAYGRVFTRASIESMHMEGVFRTQKILLDEGKIKI